MLCFGEEDVEFVDLFDFGYVFEFCEKMFGMLFGLLCVYCFCYLVLVMYGSVLGDILVISEGVKWLV